MSDDNLVEGAYVVDTGQTGEGGCGMAPDRRDAQPAQAVQIQAIPAAGAVTGERMRGSGPGGDGHQVRIAWHQREANANQRGASVRLSNRVCPVGRELYLRQTPCSFAPTDVSIFLSNLTLFGLDQRRLAWGNSGDL